MCRTASRVKARDMPYAAFFFPSASGRGLGEGEYGQRSEHFLE